MLQDGGLDEVDEAKEQDEVEMATGVDEVEVADSCDVYTESTPQSPTPSISLDITVSPPSLDLEGHGVRLPEPVLKRKRSSGLDLAKEPEKWKRAKEVEMETDDEESPEERGESRSAAASRKLKASLKTGDFAINERKRATFEEKCKRMGGDAKFRYGEKWEVLHQKCGKWFAMSEPYNTTRFKAHLNICKAKDTKGRNGCIDSFFRPQASSTGVGASGKNTKQPAVTVRRHIVIGGRSIKPDLETPPIIAESRPCLGLGEDHNHQIPKYISRALTEGAGSQSETRITTKLFGDSTKYSKLGDKAKRLVQTAQVLSRAWTINRELQVIYSSNCRKALDSTATESTCPECLSVLRLETFKKALSVEPAPLASKKYIPHRFRTSATDLAINLAEINGLPGLLEAVSPPSSPSSG